MIAQGKDILIILDGMAVAMAKSCEWSEQVELQEVASATQGENREYVPSHRIWTATSGQLVTAIRNLVLNAGAECQVAIIERGGVAEQLPAIIKSFKTTGTRGNLATGSFVFESKFGGVTRPIGPGLYTALAHAIYSSNGSHIVCSNTYS